jgi:hypothetical protein
MLSPTVTVRPAREGSADHRGVTGYLMMEAGSAAMELRIVSLARTCR